MADPTLYVLDVGHGNSAVLVDDAVIVIDAGPGATLLEFLKKEEIKNIAVVLISHADEDHIKGLISLIESKVVTIDAIHINSDALKGSATWADLAFLLDEEDSAGHLRFEVGLTTNHSDKFNTASIVVEILAPSPGLAVKGPGSKDHEGRKLTSNAMSAVVRLLREGTPLVLLPGDLDETGLDNLLSSGRDLHAMVAIFPHHGGGAANTEMDKFAAREALHRSLC
jgi:beta-lactamase superfamily II metal-dependent hydrolase